MRGRERPRVAESEPAGRAAEAGGGLCSGSVRAVGTIVLEPEVAEDVESWVPPPWRVVLHNDDVTTMEFVVHLLKTLFHKSEPDAVRLMLEVHQTGAATVAVCPRERAELYVEQVASLARPRGFPLTATAEPV